MTNAQETAGRRHIPPARLRTWIASVLAARDLTTDDAVLVADALVDSSLYGFDTHGVGLLPAYVDRLARGVTNPRPDIGFERRGALIKIDADRGHGQVAVMRALAPTIELAGRHGLAAAAIRNVGHLGALGYFTRKASEAGVLALLMQNGPPVMGLPGFTRRAIGNNPYSFAIPLAGRPPIVFDGATSEAAYGKVARAARNHEPIPENWALDHDGKATRSAQAAADGILLPFGGFKGIGLSMLIEAFAGSLTGMRPGWEEHIFGAFLLVVDPDAAIEREGFDAGSSQWLDHYLGSGRNARYPGQRADAVRAQRERHGIPVDDALWQAFAAVAHDGNPPLPG